jgi:hypothetical protein
LKASTLEDLGSTYETIVTYMVTSGIRYFTGSLASEGSAVRYAWDERNTDWKEFVDIAKEAGAPCVAVRASKGTGSHSEELGLLELSWSRDGVVYSFSISAPWWGNSEVKGDWTLKTDEELLADILNYGENAYRKGEMPPIGVVADEFWESRGISASFSRNPDLKMRMTKINKMAEDQVIAKDRELIGLLAGDIVLWVRVKGLKLADKRSVEEYLAEKGINLSAVAKDELRQMVNFRLSARSG